MAALKISFISAIPIRGSGSAGAKRLSGYSDSLVLLLLPGLKFSVESFITIAFDSIK
jgi:hypothetical protein